jgi:hypothetical protein
LPYQTDYVLRLIEQLGAMIRKALEKLGAKDPEEPCRLAGQAIGAALAMDPALASSLSPQSLVSLLELSEADSRVIELVAQAIEVEATELENRGDVVASEFRHQQANAVRSLLRA